jgi:hypothetical protein
MRKDKMKTLFAFPLSLTPHAEEFMRLIPRDFVPFRTAGWTFSISLSKAGFSAVSFGGECAEKDEGRTSNVEL